MSSEPYIRTLPNLNDTVARSFFGVDAICYESMNTCIQPSTVDTCDARILLVKVCLLDAAHTHFATVFIPATKLGVLSEASLRLFEPTDPCGRSRTCAHQNLEVSRTSLRRKHLPVCCRHYLENQAR